MKKRALRKDFYMEIRRSLGRFLSIFFIVAIGCAFFSGIRASEPDMRYSGDAYFDNKNMMDLRIISTMGLTEDDVKAASKAEGIGHVEGRYSVDALLADGDNQIVVHVMSMLPTMNEIQLEDGRLPNKENECVVDVDYHGKKQTEDRRYDHVFKRYGCRGYRFFENGYVSDHRYSEQSGVYCFSAGQYDNRKRKCAGVCICTGRKLCNGRLYRDLYSGGRSKRIDGIYFGI